MKKVALASKVITEKNLSKLKKIINDNKTLISKYDGIDSSAITKKNRIILDYYYYLIENSDFKDELIKKNNDAYKYDRRLRDECTSKPSKYNKIENIKPRGKGMFITFDQVLENTSSEDIVTKNFKDNEYALDDELMQKVSSWSNRLAHHCLSEIVEIQKKMKFERDNDTKPYEFKKKLDSALTEYSDENSKNHFDIKYIQKNLKDMPSNLYDIEDENVKNALKLIKKHYPNKVVDKDFLSKYLYCLKLGEAYTDFFNIKTQATSELILYQDRNIIPPEKKGEYDEDPILITFMVEDNTKKTSKDQETCRIVSMNRKEYETYVRFNNSYFYTDAYVDTYAKKYNTDEHTMRNNMEKISKGTKLSKTEVNAFMIDCAVSSFHVPKKSVLDFMEEKNIKKIDTGYPPLVENLAYYGSTLYDITPSPQKDEVIKDILKEQRDICENNKSKYISFANPEEAFNHDNNLGFNIQKNFNVR